MFNPRLALFVLLSALVPSHAQELHYWGTELKPVLDVLQIAHLSGSIELEGRCDPMHLPRFPQFGNSTTTAPSALVALKEIAASDPTRMTVTQDTDGTIRMIEKGVPNDILNVKISRILFQDYGGHYIHSANLAVRIILDSPEVVAFMQDHDIARPNGAIGIGGASSGVWPSGSPYISGSLDNTTVLEALDHVLEAFPGEVFVYWNCPKTEDKNGQKPKDTSHKRRDDESGFFSDCLTSVTGDSQYAVLPPGVPNPFCRPPSLWSGMPKLPSPIGATNARRFVIAFFAMKKFGEKTIVVGG